MFSPLLGVRVLLSTMHCAVQLHVDAPLGNPSKFKSVQKPCYVQSLKDSEGGLYFFSETNAIPTNAFNAVCRYPT